MWPNGLKTSILFHSTDLNPCLNVHCPRFGVCKTYSAHDARCECFDQCPSYQDPVCTANGTTYDNKCWHELSYCRGLENNLVYHPGSCEGKKDNLSISLDINPYVDILALSRLCYSEVIVLADVVLMKLEVEELMC